jgi:hypothetical protein
VDRRALGFAIVAGAVIWWLLSRNAPRIVAEGQGMASGDWPLDPGQSLAGELDTFAPIAGSSDAPGDWLGGLDLWRDRASSGARAMPPGHALHIPQGDEVPFYDDAGRAIGWYSESAGRLSALTDYVDQASESYGVRPELINAVIQVESGGNPGAQSATSSARGLMQVTRAAAIDVGADYDRLFDPQAGIDAGTAYLAGLIAEFGERDGVRAYYAGPGNIRREREGRGNAAILADADRYAERVLGRATT